MIIVKDLFKTYDQDIHALNGISLEIKKGSIFGVIGLSGAGKSSLIRCISTIEKPTSGDIFIDNKNISSLTEKQLLDTRKKIGMVFQHFNLLLNKTVYDNIAFPLRLYNYPKKDIEKRVIELLELVGLSDKKDAFPSNLSGGQKQRVGIARALSAKPELLICDEATSALDPVTTKSILELLKDINKKLNITMLVITHEMSVIKEICDKVAIMEKGKIIEEGDVISSFANPKTELAKSFFNDSSLNLTNSVYEKIANKKNLVAKINFIGDSAINPFIGTAIKKFDLQIAILAGNIQEINKTIIGTLVIELDGDKNKINSCLKYFAEEKLIVEVISDNVNG